MPDRRPYDGPMRSPSDTPRVEAVPCLHLTNEQLERGMVCKTCGYDPRPNDEVERADDLQEMLDELREEP